LTFQIGTTLGPLSKSNEFGNNLWTHSEFNSALVVWSGVCEALLIPFPDPWGDRHMSGVIFTTLIMDVAARLAISKGL
jgi:hypothetical protein